MAEDSSTYYAVFYSKDGTIHLWPSEAKENQQQDCLDKLKGMIQNDSQIAERCKATTVIKRDMSQFKEGYIFGHSKSLDVAPKEEKA